MSKIAIVTDSTIYLPKNLVEQYGIIVLPQVLIWGNETFEDGVNITPTEFYTRLQKAAVMPSSSQISPGTFEKTFRSLHEAGNEILSINVSSKFSGTLDSAIQAKAMLPQATIELVDSYSTSMGAGFQILAAARAAEKGASLAECKTIAEKARDYTGILVLVDTLEFLHRGGRIGGGARFLGTALQLKPILEVRDGRLEAVERVRTRSKALARMLELVQERIAGRTPLHLAVLHANAKEEAQALLDSLAAQFKPVETVLTDVSPVVGVHVGPGTIGVAFMAGM